MTKRTIVFVDIVGSTRKWKRFPKRMESALKHHFSIVERLAEKYNGVVVKTIGDADMVVFEKGGFDSLKRAIGFAMELQYNHEDPLGFRRNLRLKLELRIGIAFGPVQIIKVDVQHCEGLEDFFGTTVNIAARLESKMSPIGGFAFHSTQNIPTKWIKELEKTGKVTKIKLEKDCGSVIMSEKGVKCINVSKLKGITPITAYTYHLQKMI